MSKKENAGVRISKYAAKKENSVDVHEIIDEQNAATDVDETDNKEKTYKSYKSNKFTKEKNKDGIPAIADKFPTHVVQIALLLKNNAEIRRFTAIGILNWLLQKGEIVGEKRYVSFKWNKFAVKSNGLMREYSYNEPFFINALVASFSSFSASAQRVIDQFCKKEMSIDITKAVDQNEINNIVALNEEYQESADSVVEQ